MNFMKLAIASANTNKITEIRDLLPASFVLVDLNDLNISEDIPEEQETLEGNAHQKASWLFSRYHFTCIADDTGLEVEALNGKPGVHSARYSGESRDPAANMNKLLQELEGIGNRKARFRTVICYISNSETKYFEGVVNGRIIDELKGEGGFGYDPVFIPDGYDQTFAEMSKTQKNHISHRGRAIASLISYLEKQV